MNGVLKLIGKTILSYVIEKNGLSKLSRAPARDNTFHMNFDGLISSKLRESCDQTTFGDALKIGIASSMICTVKTFCNSSICCVKQQENDIALLKEKNDG
jgi:hypothetical protein